MHEEDRVYLCTNWITPERQCHNKVEYRRWKIGKFVCMACGDKQAVAARKSWCVAPISNKAAYTLITDPTLLKQINPKRTET